MIRISHAAFGSRGMVDDLEERNWLRQLAYAAAPTAGSYQVKNKRRLEKGTGLAGYAVYVIPRVEKKRPAGRCISPPKVSRET
jgi:hypothetical protein